jgi:hypothetical protein
MLRDSTSQLSQQKKRLSMAQTALRENRSPKSVLAMRRPHTKMEVSQKVEMPEILSSQRGPGYLKATGGGPGKLSLRLPSQHNKS